MRHVTSLYVHVSTDVERFEIEVSTHAPGETAAGYLVSPSGEKAASFDTSETGEEHIAARNPGGMEGFWALVLHATDTGALDDVFVTLGEGLSPWILTDPAVPLEVRSAGR